MSLLQSPDGSTPVVRKPRLSNQIYELIRSDLRSGNYAADVRFTEPGIARALKTSRTPVREALFQLVNNGLLCEYERGYGLPRLSRDDIAEMMEIRIALEGLLIRKICQKATAADLAELEAAVAKERKAISRKDAAPFIAANSTFREILYNACANAFLKESVELYSDRLQIFRVLTLDSKENRGFVTEAHEKLVAAVAERNEEKAVAILTDLLQRAAAAYMEKA